MIVDDLAWRHPEIARDYPLPWALGEFSLANDGHSKSYTLDGIVCGGLGIARIQTGEFIVVWLAVGAVPVVCTSKPRAMAAVEAMLRFGDWSTTSMPGDPRAVLKELMKHGGVIGYNRGDVLVAVVENPPT